MDMTPEEIKDMLLEHYATKSPSYFLQYDAIARKRVHPYSRDELDEDGELVNARPTYELMNGADVRVLIREGTDKRTAVRLLWKIPAWTAHEGFDWIAQHPL